MRERRVYENPIANVSKLNTKIDVRHARRALDPTEVRTLLASAAKGTNLFGMSGAERALIYRTAVETGLRQNELRTLTRGCLELDTLAITVRAAYSKHRREDVVPIRPALAEELRRWVQHKAPAARVFSIPNRYKTLRAFYADLAAAGIARRDPEKRGVDFHSLRHTFITALATAGVHPKTAQVLARHSTITLTMDRYTHTLRGAEAAALSTLPDYASTPPTAQKATGTDGAAPENVPGNHMGASECHGLPAGLPCQGGLLGGCTGLGGDLPSAQSAATKNGQTPENMRFSGVLSTEAEGFEPPEDLRPLRFSRPVH